MAKGSARSIPSFNIHQALSDCGDLLARFGGHRQAAGLGLAADRLGALQSRLAGIMAQTLTQDDFVRMIEIDAAVRISDITFPLIDELSRMEPFGSVTLSPCSDAGISSRAGQGLWATNTSKCTSVRTAGGLTASVLTSFVSGNGRKRSAH